jgi:hypothetical protein
VPVLCETDPLSSPRSTDHTCDMAIYRVGHGSLGTLKKAPGGLTHLLVAIDKFTEGKAPSQNQLKAGGEFHPGHYLLFWHPQLHHHRQLHPVHRIEVPRFL